MTFHLDSIFTLPNGHVVPNRIAKAATAEDLADPTTGKPSPELVQLYKRLGRGGSGMLITGNVAVSLDARTSPGNVVITDDSFVPQLREWAQVAQENGSQLWMQINHAGRQVPKKVSRQPVAPSAVGLKGKGGLFAIPRPLTEEEIAGIIAGFAVAAKLAMQTGFSGVQIHAAHGYLASQFLSPLTNHRTDRWGGSLENRSRFLLEIVGAIREQVGAQFPISVKLNSADFQRGGFTETESMDVVRALQDAGIDLLEISGGSYEQSAMMGNDGTARDSTTQREAYFLSYAKKVRQCTTLPLLLTGGLRTAATMRQIIADGDVDFVGMARPLLVEPDLPKAFIARRQDSATPVNTKVGIRLFDDLLQIVWFQAQIRRMGAGLDPDPKLGRWRALLGGIYRNYF